MEEVFLAMVTKTMELHVLPSLEFVTIMFALVLIIKCLKVASIHLFW